MRSRCTQILALWLFIATVAFAQYPYSLEPAQLDTLVVDTLRTDSIPQPVQEEAVQDDPAARLRSQALTWVRHLLYRGFLDDEVSGVMAVYALTEWKESTGPFGPVIAHLSITYHGGVSWMGKNAAWLQATYKSLETDRPSVDFDLVVERGEKIGEVYRGLWRMNKEPFSNVSFVLPQSVFDDDRLDQPRPGEKTELKLYSGTFPVTVYRGSGAEGAKVVAYRSTGIPPLGLVRLGYGTHCLNLRDRAVDVEPRFEVPLPTSR
ncbi:hypothetical protein KJZ99_09530 [bacterium]|nr:hypothetical protein [bacterium]